LGELPPDQRGKSDQQLMGGPAVGKIIADQAKGKPLQPVQAPAKVWP